MHIRWQMLAAALMAGLLAVALPACSGTGQGQGGPATSRPATSPPPAVPTTAAQVQGHVYSVVNAATSVHVNGSYRWPHARLTDNVGLLQSGQMAGFIDDAGLPIAMVDVDGKMYVKLTPALAHYYNTTCAPYCGEYSIYPRSTTRGLVASMGVKSTLQVLMQMADNFLSKPIRTNFHGQPALQMMAPGYDRGAYVIVVATPQSLPLEAVDPGHFKLAFSKWNSVPTPHAPPKSKIHAVP